MNNQRKNHKPLNFFIFTFLNRKPIAQNVGNNFSVKYCCLSREIDVLFICLTGRLYYYIYEKWNLKYIYMCKGVLCLKKRSNNKGRNKRKRKGVNIYIYIYSIKIWGFKKIWKKKWKKVKMICEFFFFFYTEKFVSGHVPTHGPLCLY